MAIKFVGKDQTKAAPAVTKAPAEKIDREPAATGPAAPTGNETPDGADLFNADAKATGKRKRNGFRR